MIAIEIFLAGSDMKKYLETCTKNVMPDPASGPFQHHLMWDPIDRASRIIEQRIQTFILTFRSLFPLVLQPVAGGK